MRYYCRYKSPLGELFLGEEDNQLTLLIFDKNDHRLELYTPNKTPLLIETKKQLDQYFLGQRKNFQIPLSLQGTPFQSRVWGALQVIPYGKIKTYKDIALAINNPKASRAVGLANNRNPVSIIVPCHRVVGQGGKLTGYGGGLKAKQFLLELERQNV